MRQGSIGLLDDRVGRGGVGICSPCAVDEELVRVHTRRDSERDLEGCWPRSLSEGDAVHLVVHEGIETSHQAYRTRGTARPLESNRDLAVLHLGHAVVVLVLDGVEVVQAGTGMQSMLTMARRRMHVDIVAGNVVVPAGGGRRVVDGRGIVVAIGLGGGRGVTNDGFGAYAAVGVPSSAGSESHHDGGGNRINKK